MPIRKFTNGRFSLKRFTAPGVGGSSTPAAPAAPTSYTAVQVFTGSQTWTPPSGVTSVDYMVLGGGGGGGKSNGGGGGGAGGYQTGTGITVTPGTS